jgi:hypothetical protein
MGALKPLAAATLVDSGQVRNALAHVDLEPVKEAMAMALSHAVDDPELIAERFVNGMHESSSALTTRLVDVWTNSKMAWPQAIERAAEVHGVPPEFLGTYPVDAKLPMFPESVRRDKADRVLMSFAGSLSSIPDVPAVLAKSYQFEEDHPRGEGGKFRTKEEQERDARKAKRIKRMNRMNAVTAQAQQKRTTQRVKVERAEQEQANQAEQMRQLMALQPTRAALQEELGMVPLKRQSGLQGRQSQPKVQGKGQDGPSPYPEISDALLKRYPGDYPSAAIASDKVFFLIPNAVSSIIDNEFNGTPLSWWNLAEAAGAAPHAVRKFNPMSENEFNTFVRNKLLNSTEYQAAVNKLISVGSSGETGRIGSAEYQAALDNVSRAAQVVIDNAPEFREYTVGWTPGDEFLIHDANMSSPVPEKWLPAEGAKYTPLPTVTSGSGVKAEVFVDLPGLKGTPHKQRLQVHFPATQEFGAGQMYGGGITSGPHVAVEFGKSGEWEEQEHPRGDRGLFTDKPVSRRDVRARRFMAIQQQTKQRRSRDVRQETVRAQQEAPAVAAERSKLVDLFGAREQPLERRQSGLQGRQRRESLSGLQAPLPRPKATPHVLDGMLGFYTPDFLPDIAFIDPKGAKPGDIWDNEAGFDANEPDAINPHMEPVANFSDIGVDTGSGASKSIIIKVDKGSWFSNTVLSNAHRDQAQTPEQANTSGNAAYKKILDYIQNRHEMLSAVFDDQEVAQGEADRMNLFDTKAGRDSYEWVDEDGTDVGSEHYQVIPAPVGGKERFRIVPAYADDREGSVVRNSLNLLTGTPQAWKEFARTGQARIERVNTSHNTYDWDANDLMYGGDKILSTEVNTDVALFRISPVTGERR